MFRLYRFLFFIGLKLKLTHKSYCVINNIKSIHFLKKFNDTLDCQVSWCLAYCCFTWVSFSFKILNCQRI